MAYPAVSSRAVLHTSTGGGFFASSHHPSHRTVPPASRLVTVMMMVCDAFALVRFLIRCTTGDRDTRLAGRMADRDSVPVTPPVPENVTTPPVTPGLQL